MGSFSRQVCTGTLAESQESEEMPLVAHWLDPFSSRKGDVGPGSREMKAAGCSCAGGLAPRWSLVAVSALSPQGAQLRGPAC